ATEIFLQAEDQSAQAIAEQFSLLIEQTKKGDFSPVINRGKKEYFHVFDLKQFSGEKEYLNNTNHILDTFYTIKQNKNRDKKKENFNNNNHLLDTCYATKANRDRVKQEVGDLSRLMKNELEKNQRKIKKQQQTLKKAEQADVYQKQGELLTAHLHLVNRGDSK